MEKRRAMSKYTTREVKRRVDIKRRTRTSIYALVMPVKELDYSPYNVLEEQGGAYI